MSEFGLLKRVARHIRYRKLDVLTGTQLEVQDWDSLDAKLSRLIATAIPDDAIISVKPLQLGAFLKYGILDIDVLVESHLLKNDYRRGVYLLDEMGWLDRESEFSDLVADESISFLMDLWDDIEKDETYLKLFLQAINTSPAASPDIDLGLYDGFARKGLEKLFSLGKSYRLPNTFEVSDAYLTNARRLGLWKNFYL